MKRCLADVTLLSSECTGVAKGRGGKNQAISRLFLVSTNLKREGSEPQGTFLKIQHVYVIHQFHDRGVWR